VIPSVGFKDGNDEVLIMSSIELTPSQKNILQELVNLYRKTETAVKGEDIAEQVDRNPGTIRNQMQSLKALQLVEGVPGPKGGYKPTANAYDALQVEEMDDAADVPLQHNGENVEDANVEEIDLTSVHHPEECRAEIKLQGSISRFHEGDTVTVGPTPLSKLRIIGTVEGQDDTNNIIILTIDDMKAPVGEVEK
jgi:predicted transcriptional regulator